MNLQVDKVELKIDDRGVLGEIFHFPNDGQVHFIKFTPKAVRGKHYHKRKQEQFVCLYGSIKAKLRHKETGEKIELVLLGTGDKVLSIPPMWVHEFENISPKESCLLAWNNELYNPEDADAYFESYDS